MAQQRLCDGADGVLLVVVGLLDAADLEHHGAGLEGVTERVQVEVGQPVDRLTGDEDAALRAEGEPLLVEVDLDVAVGRHAHAERTPGLTAAEHEQGVLTDPRALVGRPELVGVILEQGAQGVLDDVVEQRAGLGFGRQVGADRP